MNEYFGNTTDPLKIRDNFLDLGGDVMFVVPSISTAAYHRGMRYIEVLIQDHIVEIIDFIHVKFLETVQIL